MEKTLNNKTQPPRSLWITLEGDELLELRRIGMDKDGEGALTFFHEVLIPRLYKAARERAVALDLLEEGKINGDLSR